MMLILGGVSPLAWFIVGLYIMKGEYRLLMMVLRIKTYLCSYLYNLNTSKHLESYESIETNLSVWKSFAWGTNLCAIVYVLIIFIFKQGLFAS